MTEAQANTIASIWSGITWQPMPGIWMVVIMNHDGSIVIVDDGGVGEYECHEDFAIGDPSAQIFLE